MHDDKEKEIDLGIEEKDIEGEESKIILDKKQEGKEEISGIDENSEEKKQSSENKIVMYIKNMSAFEKLFWIIIFLFSIAYTVLVGMASYNSAASSKEHNNTMVAPDEIVQEIEVMVTSDRIKKNLENNRTVMEIKKNLQKNMFILDKKIDIEINKVFQQAYRNIDPFLDFHYSVIGEYMELGGMAAGTMEKMIQQKLFGSDFSIRLQNSMQVISGEYEIRLAEHFNFINQQATTKVNINLNSEIINDLQKHIEQNIKIQGTKIGALMTAKLAPKIAQMAAAKIAAKSSSKIAAKLATKVGAKSAAAASGATAGALCGPAFWICSPIAAGVLWFGTDAVVSSIDEIYNRDEFKQDIMDSLVRQQNTLKRKLKKSYERTAKKLSEEIVVKYKEAPVKEIKRVKVKEKIGL
jgi:hypothetical protein